MAVYLESPYRPDGLWLRGNLHTHTTRSDGQDSPEAMIRGYAEFGHDFLAISDHDQPALTDQPTVGNLILLPAVEVSAGYAHVLDVGSRRMIQPDLSQQALLDAINADSGFPVLCHPVLKDRYDHYPWEQLRHLTGYVGLEIFNGGCLDQHNWHSAVEKWDLLLGLGRKVWGFANDDSHSLEEIGRGWNVVRAADRTAEAILEAFRQGSFYASTGVTINQLECSGADLYVRASNAQQILIFTRDMRCIHAVKDSELLFDASDVDGQYLRVVCYGREGAMAMSQPISVRGGQWDLEMESRYAIELVQEQPAELHVARARHAPTLSGKGDDPLWASPEPFDQFYSLQDGSPAPVSTEVRALAVDDTLILLFRCEALPSGNFDMGLRESPWECDSVEIFFDPSGDGVSSYHLLVINAPAGSFAGCHNTRRQHLLPIQAAVSYMQEDAWKGWVAELSISLAELGGTPPPGTVWRFHLCRNRLVYLHDIFMSWNGQFEPGGILNGVMYW